MGGMTSLQSGFQSPQSLALALLNGIRQPQTLGQEQPDPIETLVATAKKAQALKLSGAKMEPQTLQALMQSAQEKVDQSRSAAFDQLPEARDPLVRRLYELSLSERSADLTATERAMLGDDGSDYVRVSTPQMEREEMQEHVLHYLRNYWDVAPKEMWDAYEAGTLSFERAQDTPGMSVSGPSYEIYRDGNYVGVKGLYSGAAEAPPKTPIMDHVQSLKDKGLGVQYGSIAGQDYIITWPDTGAKGAS